MPPKQVATADTDDNKDIWTLCQVMITATEFKIDNAALAPILGIAQAKNVPRKINAIIGPDFELRGGRVVRKVDNDGQAPATPGKADSGNPAKASSTKKAPSTPSTNGKRKAKSATPASKKRKTDASDDADVDDGDEVKNEDHVDSPDTGTRST